MGGISITNKPKTNKWQVGSGGDTHLNNNLNSSITQFPPYSNQDIPSETPPVDAQSTNKTRQMDSKYWSITALGITVLAVLTLIP